MRKRLVGCDAVRWFKRAAIAASALFICAVSFSIAAQAETRTLKLYNTHTKERVSITFKKNGRYIPGGLREANRFLRDWRRNEMIKMDPELLDLIWEVYKKVGGREHVYVVSSYRSPATNNMLRKRSKGVARNSQHTLGKAMDFYIPGVNLTKLRAAGLRKHVGGVGYYPRSGSPFVHMDTGRVRHWPRMSRSQLVKVFPKGRTLHVPSDGKPLKGYKIALAEAKSGKSGSRRPTIIASSRDSNSRPATTRDQQLTNPGEPIVQTNSGQQRSGGRNLFASLFGGDDDKPSGGATRSGTVTPPQNIASVAQTAPVIENPPVPGRKVLARPADPLGTAIASLAQDSKPAIDAPTQLANAAPAPIRRSNTLNAQRSALASGQPSTASQPLGDRFQIAQSPAQKPNSELTSATQTAAAKQNGNAVPIPASAPTNPVAAIAAATGTTVPSPSPAPRPETTLAYASAAATPPSLNRSLRPAISAQPDPTSNTTASNQRPQQATVSGRIPRDQIIDPLAGFASLPDKSEPALLSGMGTTRQQAFAWLRHPNQRQLKNVMLPGNRFVAASFEPKRTFKMRTDRFAGPAIVVLPVRFAR
ncbi:MAG: DUF882 domain-containing protein [Roseibium sp.]